MFESFPSPQKSYEEPSSEKPASQLVSGKTKHDIQEQASADEAELLRRIEERARKYPGEPSLLTFEKGIDRALSDNALEVYKKEYILHKDSELPFFRLMDLGDCLRLLEQFKDRLRNRYRANINKVVEHADTIKKIFLDYRSLRKKGEGRDLADVSVLLSALDVLSQIDPDVFPADLVDVTDEERRRFDDVKDIKLRKLP